MKRLLLSGIPVFLLCVIFLASACGQGKMSEAAAVPAAARGFADMSVYNETAGTAAEAGVEEAADLAETFPLSEDPGQARKLIKRAELRLRVEDPQATEKPLAELMKKHGAWPASTGVYENSRNYSIRVPASSYDAMLAEVAGLGKLLGRTENAEDVTLRYYDLEGRLATRQELLKTYQNYLGKAANIEEILAVESRIADLQYEIDRTGTQFRNLANLVDYSTIDVEILGPVSAYSYAKPTLGEKLKSLFGSFGDVFSGALVVITGIIIYGIPAFLVLILFFSLFFGRIGLMKRLMYFAAGKKAGADNAKRKPEKNSGSEVSPE